MLLQFLLQLGDGLLVCLVLRQDLQQGLVVTLSVSALGKVLQILRDLLLRKVVELGELGHARPPC